MRGLCRSDSVTSSVDIINGGDFRDNGSLTKSFVGKCRTMEILRSIISSMKWKINLAIISTEKLREK